MTAPTFAKYILEARLRAGLTIVEFEKRFNIPNQTLSDMENGVVPQFSTYEKIVQALNELGCDEEELFRLYKEAYERRREGSAITRQKQSGTGGREV
jgi:transcriptional regulator with XRE-family HTH domain